MDKCFIFITFAKDKLHLGNKSKLHCIRFALAFAKVTILMPLYNSEK
jgi:hypothetical protein